MGKNSVYETDVRSLRKHLKQIFTFFKLKIEEIESK